MVPHLSRLAPQGLEWMLRRERQGDALGRSLLLLHPAWAQVRRCAAPPAPDV